MNHNANQSKSPNQDKDARATLFIMQLASFWVLEDEHDK